MAETCYSKGKKIILMPEQINSGTWICRFMIPGFLNYGLEQSTNAPLKEYKTEWEAKTAAFQSAKRALEAPI